MIPQYLHAFDLRLSAGLVLVEEVAPEQHHVHLLLLPNAQELVEAVEAVIVTNGQLLPVSQVDITRYQDPE
mgnify:CR=1 FL=1